MKSFAFFIAFVSASFVAACSALPADIDEQLTELRKRIDALEVENQSLRKAVAAPATAESGPVLSTSEEPGERPTESAVEPRLDELESGLALPDLPAECKEKPANVAMSASWKNGVLIASPDKEFQIHIGGRSQFDSSWYTADQNVEDNINHPYENGVDLRRARIRLDGTMYYTIDWAMEYDFVNSFNVDNRTHSVTSPTDLWVTFREVPCVNNVRIGNQKPPIGFEHLVGSRYLPFMERSYNQDAFYGGFYNGFVPGISTFDNWGEDDMGLWHMGVYKPTDNVFGFNAYDGDVSTVGRLTRLLWYECEGADLLHVGGSVMAATTVKGKQTFRARDAIRSGLSADWPIPASTGLLEGEDVQYINGELAAVRGPWTLQGEYLVSYMQDAANIVGGVVQPTVGTVSYQGGYVQLLYFLTGEHDNYNKATAVFERVIPNNNFYFRHGQVANGPGAWQIGARYNFLDLNDKGLDGGILHNVTCGLNWFLNPNLKFQFDYFATHRDAALVGDLGDGWIHGWGVRMAHDF